MPVRALHAGVRVAVVVVALGVTGYYFGRGAWSCARQVFRDFVSG